MPRRTAGLLVSLATILLLPTAATAQQNHAVAVVDSAYEPPSLTVTAGDQVTWTSTGSLPHTVTSSDGSFPDSHPDCDSFSDGPNCMNTGETYSFTFETPGTFAYYCKLHGTSDGGGMAGTIVVEAAVAETPTDAETAADDATEADAGDTGETADDAATEESSDDGLATTGTVRTAGLVVLAVVVMVAGVALLRRRETA